MKEKMRNINRFLFLTILVFNLTACSSGNRKPIPTINYATSPAIAAPVAVMPTTIAPGLAIAHKNLLVTLLQAEISQDYQTEFGSRRDPTLGASFLWVEISVKNTGTTKLKLPAPEHYSALFGTSEFKSGYAHRMNYPDYNSLSSDLFPAQEVQAWLRFDIPGDTALQSLQFVYLPESLQVSGSITSSAYEWADHPLFIWQLR